MMIKSFTEVSCFANVDWAKSIRLGFYSKNIIPSDSFELLTYSINPVLEQKKGVGSLFEFKSRHTTDGLPVATDDSMPLFRSEPISYMPSAIQSYESPPPPCFR